MFHLQRSHPDIKMCKQEKNTVPQKRSMQPDSNINNLERPGPSASPALSWTSTSSDVTSQSSETCGATKSKQPRLDDSFTRQRSFQDGGPISTDMTNKLIYMIVKDYMPFSTVEKEGFLAFMKCAAPLFKVPSRRSLVRLIETKYELLASMIKEELSGINNICLTSDIWMDSLNTKSYLGLTAHYLYNDTLKSITIGVKDLSERHTAENISKWLLELLIDWEIKKDSIIVVVTDNAANMVKAVEDTFGVDKHLPCFAHTLNLVPSKIIDTDATVNMLCKKIKSIVTYFKRSSIAADGLRELTEMKCVQSMEIRWNSTYYMLERFLKMADKIASVLVSTRSGPDMLTSSELANTEELVSMLKPFEEATKILCGEHYLTASKVIPVINTLKRKLEGYKPLSVDGNRVLKSLQDEFTKRFAKIERMNLIATATLLDPRFKKIHFMDRLACADVVNKVSKTLKNEILDAQKNKESENDAPINNSDKEDNFWSHHENLAVLNKSFHENMNHDSVPEDLKYYLHQPTIQLSEDAIKFWNNYNHSPLSNLAKRFLSIIATSVPSERLFSRAGNVMTETRNSLSSDHLNQLLFLNSLPKENWHL